MGTIVHRRDRRSQERRGSGRADRRDGVDDARRQAAAQGDDAVHLPRRRRLAHDRSDHDADRARRKVVFKDSKEGVLRHARRARARTAGRQGRSVHRRVGQARRRCRSSTTRASPASTSSSEGKKGDAVWGTRARWMMLAGTVDAEPVTLAILDHPSNPGYPTSLARPRLRTVRGQSPRREGVQLKGKRSST